MADVQKLLERIESALVYSAATLAPGNIAGRQEREWVKVHAGRASSSYNQLRLARNDLQEIRTALGVPGTFNGDTK